MIVPGHYHMVGAAGVGMSAVAQALVSRGCEVSGSDRYFDLAALPSGGAGRDLEAIRKLQRGGVRFFPQDGSGITPQTRAIVYSTAIEGDNPDLRAAGRLGVARLHRAEVLAGLIEGQRSIAVTGTSGKSTVTGLIGWILEQAGWDPSVVNGAPVLNWMTGERMGNARAGRSDVWVIEADESDRTLLNFFPEWGVITNASKDHFGEEETLRLFNRFAGQVRRGVVSGLTHPDWLRGFAPRLSRNGSLFDYKGVEFAVNIPGRHNAENALFAVAACDAAGCPLDDVRRALPGFKGIHRRLERVGLAAGVTVMDDYAHNPAKIRAAWSTVASLYPRVHGLWRPHGYGPLAAMLDELAGTFAEVCRPVDRLSVMPVFDVGGTANRAVQSGQLVERLVGRGVTAEAVGSAAEWVGAVSVRAEPGDCILVMGARDPELPLVARRVLDALQPPVTRRA